MPSLVQQMFRSTQRISINGKATCFGCERIAIIRPELDDTRKGLSTTGIRLAETFSLVLDECICCTVNRVAIALFFTLCDCLTNNIAGYCSVYAACGITFRLG